MRTTIRLDDHLLREAKDIAAQSGKTLTALVENALRETIARHRQRARRPRVRLPTFKGQGLQPGVDLDDSAGLMDVMADGR